MTEFFHVGRLLSFSKTAYLQKFPKHRVLFNANIFKGHQKIWYGDLDLDVDEKALMGLRAHEGQDLHIYSESDGRFNEVPSESSARARVTEDGVIINERR